MTILRNRVVACWFSRWLTACLVVLFSQSVIGAEKLLLKNGAEYRGTMLVMNSLSGNAIGKENLGKTRNGAPEPHNIARIDNGWQRIHCSIFNIKEPPAKAAVTKPLEINIKPPPKPPNRVHLNQPGVLTLVSPFDDFGRRRVALTTSTKTLDILQAITKVTPDHVMVESTNCDWKFGLSLKTIPFETIHQMVRKHVDLKDASARFGLARLYIEAEYYPQAYDELTAIGQDFPDKKEAIEKSQADLINFFGQEILLRLKVRKRAGQHVLAQAYAEELLKKPLSGSVVLDVQAYLRAYEESRQAIERSKILLADWQSKLNDPEKEKRIQPLRSEVNDELDFETLARLDSFLKSESDTQYEPAQRLGLAYSGWVLGAANAVPDLEQALRVWDARHEVIEYLRSDDPSDHVRIVKKLQSSENISPTAILNLVAQLPPWLDPGDVHPETPFRIETKSSEPVSYAAVLPAEYSPRHEYPLVIVLRSASNSTEETVAGWAAGAGFPGHGHDRGYVVVAPEYVEKGAKEYSYGAAAHKAVLDCLMDVRKRFAIDSDRVFLAGQGMGGDAAFDIGMAHPDEFAGVLPIGGNAINYCVYNWPNAVYTSWYAVGNGYDAEGSRDITSNTVYDHLLKGGSKFDFTLVQYFGRTGESVRDEIPKFFDWMELPSHTRQPQPKKFNIRALRKTDNRCFWVTAAALPRDYVLPMPAGETQRVIPMEIDASITAGRDTIRLNKAASENFTLRLTPELVDFDKRITVQVGSRTVFKDFVKPDIAAVLEELRLRGDRKRLPTAVISP